MQPLSLQHVQFDSKSLVGTLFCTIFLLIHTAIPAQSPDPSNTDHDRILSNAAEFSDDPNLLEQRIAELKTIAPLAKTPQAQADILYTLGIQHIWADHPFAAFRCLDQATRIDPTLNDRHPAAAFRSAAFNKWVDRFAPTATRTTVMTIAIALLLGFLRNLKRIARPRALFQTTFLFAVSWTATFAVATLTQSAFPVEHLDAYLQPVLVRHNPLSTGGEPLRTLFCYGLLSATFVPILHAGTFHSLSLRTRRWLTPLLSLLLATSLTVDFYLHHLRTHADWPDPRRPFLQQATSSITSVVQEIKSAEDIPDDMKPLYDEDFWEDQAP